MRMCLLGFLLFFCFSGFARAEWTGVEFELGDIDADWEFADGIHSAQIRSLGFRFEEQTGGGLSIGGGIAYEELLVDGKSEFDAMDFSTANFEVYLRQQAQLGESVLLEGFLSYGYYGGYENTSDDRADISWSQIDAEISLGFRIASVRLTPYARYTSVDGDISNDEGRFKFELEDPLSYGFRFDIFIEEGSYVTIRLQDGSQSGGYLTFVRRY